MKNLGERPPCPECGKKHIVSKGINWHCRDCGKNWQKICRPKRIIRPEHPCPKCGSLHVQSHNLNWLCGDCGKNWSKHYHPLIKIKRPENPCPICGSTHIWSEGTCWWCCDCGRSWVKNPQHIVLRSNELYCNLPLKITEVKTIENMQIYR